MPANKNKLYFLARCSTRKFMLALKLKVCLITAQIKREKTVLVASEKPKGLIDVGLFCGSGVTIVQSLVSSSLALD